MWGQWGVACVVHALAVSKVNHLALGQVFRVQFAQHITKLEHEAKGEPLGGVLSWVWIAPGLGQPGLDWNGVEWSEVTCRVGYVCECLFAFVCVCSLASVNELTNQNDLCNLIWLTAKHCLQKVGMQRTELWLVFVLRHFQSAESYGNTNKKFVEKKSLLI